MKEVKGTLVEVDKNLFIETIKHLSENSMLEKFSEFLDKESVTEIVLDVNSANKLKEFLSFNDGKSDFSQMVVKCSCGGPTRPPRPSPIRG